MSASGEDWPGRQRSRARADGAAGAVARFDAATTEFVARVFAICGSCSLVGLLALRFVGPADWSDLRMGRILLVALFGVSGSVVARVSLHAGWSALANGLLVVLALVATAVATWNGGPLPNPGLFGYLIVAVVAALLLPARAAIATGAASLATIAGVALLQEWFPRGPWTPRETLLHFLVSLVTTGTIISVILLRATRRARLAISHEVEQAKLLEQKNRELGEHEARLRCIAANTRELVAEVDAEGRIVYASPNHFEVTGRTAQEHLGRQARDYIHPDDLAQRAGQYPVPGSAAEPFRVRVADGSWRWLEVVTTPFEAADGATRLLSISRDVTTRVDAQARASQRREAENHAQKMEALGRLAGGITHELNNLMTVITLNVELLGGGEGMHENGVGPLEHIRDAAEEATSLTRRLLGFARRGESLEASVDVDAQVHDLGRLLRPLVGANVEFDLTLGAGDGHVEMDRTELTQLLLNLVVNARGAVGDGGKIEVATREVEFSEPRDCHSGPLPPGRYVAIGVSDSGRGMDSYAQARIFEPFFTTRQHDGGTGLGLALVYGIVRRAGGDVLVTSAPGTGTRIEAILPRIAAPAASPGRGRVDLRELHGDETVLVVEDQPSVRLAMSRIVRALGYRVIEASCGEQALELERSRDEPLHLLLTDVVMPGMQGPELARELCRRRPGLRVVYLTGYAGQAFSDERAPDHPVLYKPASRDALAAKLRAVLDAPASVAAPPSQAAASPATPAH